MSSNRSGLSMEGLLAMDESEGIGRSSSGVSYSNDGSGISMQAMEYYKKESRKERRFTEGSSIREKVSHVSLSSL